MWSNIVLEDLHSCKNRCIRFLEIALYILSVPKFSVEPFHAVVVQVAAHSDMTICRITRASRSRLNSSLKADSKLNAQSVIRV